MPVGGLAQPAQSVSHRGAWMGLGAVVAVLAIVAVIAIAPWKKTSATPASVAAPVAPAAASEPPAPVAAQPPAQPEPQAPPAAAPAPQVSAPVSTPVSASPRVPSRPAGAAKSVPAVSQPAAQQPVAEQPPPPVQQPAPQQPAAPSRAELQEVRESLALVSVRAAGIRTSLQSLQRSQGGLNLRGDMQAAANLMSTYLDGAEAALNAGDVAQARTFLEKAEPQVQKLEKFFNR
jgi:outer membrane biosynthesis protein TonB